MILDNSLMFTGTSNGGSGGISSGSYTDIPSSSTVYSTNVVDLGVVLGIPSYANGGGARDIGTGDDPSLKLMIKAITDFNTLTSMTIKLQGAPDNGSGSPGSYSDMWISPDYALASLVAGAELANVDVPRPALGQALPRFLRLAFVVTGSANTTGQVEGTIVVDRFDQVVGSSNNLSGYQSGVTIPN